MDLAKQMADSAVAGRKLHDTPAHVGMVIDLTNTGKYYDAARWQELGVRYVKVGGWVQAT